MARRYSLDKLSARMLDLYFPYDDSLLYIPSLPLVARYYSLDIRSARMLGLALLI